MTKTNDKNNLNATPARDNGRKVIFPAKLALETLKFSAYEDTAYALAEIVDNSFTAGAKEVHIAVICGKKEDGSGRDDTPKTIAVLDNGGGMERDALQNSVQFGNGENQGKSVDKIKGLGRFGVGLLASSFNQCRSLEVWSWTHGLFGDNGDSALKVGLNYNDIAAKEEHNFIPPPIEEKLPDYFREVFAGFPDISRNPRSGTLVVWRDFHDHNPTWKKQETLCKHLQSMCSRVYRNFIAEGKLKIVMQAWQEDSGGLRKLSEPKFFQSIDPMFLSCWNDKDLNAYSKEKPMFRVYSTIHGDDPKDEAGRVIPKKYTVRDSSTGKEIGCYRILASHMDVPYVRDKSFQEHNTDAGNEPYGKIADKLRGVSILRNGRELKLDTKWLMDQTADRWIKVSIDFDPTLDDIMGVSHDKQNARHLSAFAGKGKEIQSIEGSSAANEHVLEIAKKIHKILGDMRKIVKLDARGRGRKTTVVLEDIQTPEVASDASLRNLTRLTEMRGQENPAPMDREDPAENKGKIKDLYGESGYGKDFAKDVRPDHVLQHSIKTDFVSEDLEELAIFMFRQAGGVLLTILNTKHPMYTQLEKLCEIRNGNGDEDGEDESVAVSEADRLKMAITVIRVLIYSFNRAHHECTDRRDKEAFESVRSKWGSVAYDMMDEEE